MRTVTKIEIDDNSGFCFGVVTAIRKAEEELEKSGSLFCLGDIVHNAGEVERLESKGLKTITHSDLDRLHDSTVLLRAHGEPPSTYLRAKENNINVIDATCPVVLQLQRRIKNAYDDACRRLADGEIDRLPLFLIYGKPGHAEVNGLVGQTNGNAIVVPDIKALDSIDLSRDIFLYSQTTKSIDGFREIVDAIKRVKTTGSFQYFDTICRQVSGRMKKMKEFAASHEAVVFVSGSKSSNGKILFEECRNVNPRTYFVSDEKELNPELLRDAESIGICGATSTPHWLMAKVCDTLTNLLTKIDKDADKDPTGKG